MARPWFKPLLGFCIGGIFLGLIAWQVEWARVLDVLAGSEPAWLIPIGVTLAVHYVLKGLRWRELLKGHSDCTPNLAIRLTLVGFLLNNIFPARVGELGRPYLLSTNDKRVSFAFGLATVLGDKMFDLLLVIASLLIASTRLALPDWAVRGIWVLTAACGGLFVAGFIGARWHRFAAAGSGGQAGRLFSKLDRLASGGSLLGRVMLGFAGGFGTISSPRRFALALMWGLGSFLFLLAAVYMTMAMVNIESGLVLCLWTMGMTGVGFMIPSAPTNAGNFHYFASSALILVGAAEPEVAFSFALISHISQVVVVSLMGAVSLHGLDWRRLKEMEG